LKQDITEWEYRTGFPWRENTFVHSSHILYGIEGFWIEFVNYLKHLVKFVSLNGETKNPAGPVRDLLRYRMICGIGFNIRC